MGYDLTLSGLLRKRGEMAGQVEALQAQLAILGPDGTMHHRGDFEIPPGFFDGLLRGELTIVLAVIVSYRDAFGRRRLTTGRYYFDRNTKGPDRKYALKVCAKGTSAN